MYVANKNIYTNNKIYFKGETVPDDLINEHLTKTGAVFIKGKSEKANTTEINEAKVKKHEKHVEEQKVEDAKVKAENTKKEILTENSSNVDVVKDNK